MYFSVDSCGDVDYHDTEEAARNSANDALGVERDEAGDGWSECVKGIAWGKVLGMVTETSREPYDENNPKHWGCSGCDYVVDYSLQDVESGTPPADTYLLINYSAGFVGNSLLFWQAGGNGYTPNIDDAKRWTSEEADKKIHGCRGTHQFAKVPLSVVESVATRTVDYDDLKEAIGKRVAERMTPAACEELSRRMEDDEVVSLEDVEQAGD